MTRNIFEMIWVISAASLVFMPRVQSIDTSVQFFSQRSSTFNMAIVSSGMELPTVSDIVMIQESIQYHLESVFEEENLVETSVIATELEWLPGTIESGVNVSDHSTLLQFYAVSMYHGGSLPSKASLNSNINKAFSQMPKFLDVLRSNWPAFQQANDASIEVVAVPDPTRVDDIEDDNGVNVIIKESSFSPIDIFLVSLSALIFCGILAIIYRFIRDQKNFAALQDEPGIVRCDSLTSEPEIKADLDSAVPDNSQESAADNDAFSIDESQESFAESDMDSWLPEPETSVVSNVSGQRQDQSDSPRQFDDQLEAMESQQEIRATRSLELTKITPKIVPIPESHSWPYTAKGPTMKSMILNAYSAFASASEIPRRPAGVDDSDSSFSRDYSSEAAPSDSEPSDRESTTDGSDSGSSLEFNETWFQKRMEFSSSEEDDSNGEDNDTFSPSYPVGAQPLAKTRKPISSGSAGSKSAGTSATSVGSFIKEEEEGGVST